MSQPAIVVTGGCGFIGSHAVGSLLESYPDHLIVNVDNLEYCASHLNIPTPKASNYVFEKTDIRVHEEVEHVFNKYNVVEILHFAAESHVDNSFMRSVTFTQANVLGTHHLLECALKLAPNLHRFLHISTDEVYGEVHGDDLKEDALLNPTNPYAASKAGAEQLVSSYVMSFGLPAVIVRMNNAYGPHQYPEKVIPRFIRLLQEGKPLTLQGDGSQTRRFMYVTDVVSGVLTAWKKGQIGLVYNVGTLRETSVLAIGEMLAQKMNVPLKWTVIPDRNVNDQRYAIDAAKLRLLGWEPQVDLEEGLDLTIAWYKEHSDEHWIHGLRWLVYGHAGWIGGQVCKLLRSYGDLVIEAKARADDLEAVSAELMSIKPDRVVCLIGRTHGPGFSTIDYLEQPGKLHENVRDNLVAPMILAEGCRARGIHLTYLGTGCIFDNLHDTTETYNEESKPNFFGSGYSTVKGFTDVLMHMYEGHVLNCRIRMPIVNWDCPRNFVSKIIRYERVINTQNSMTYLPELLPVMLNAAAKKKTGTINLTNPGTISHNEILALYKEIVDPDFSWKNFSIEEQNELLKNGRSNNHLTSDKLLDWYPEVTPISGAIRNCLESWSKTQP